MLRRYLPVLRQDDVGRLRPSRRRCDAVGACQPAVPLSAARRTAAQAQRRRLEPAERVEEARVEEAMTVSTKLANRDELGSLRANEARDRSRRLGQLGVGFITALGQRLGHAVAEVLVEQTQSHRL